jgi:hypothetical protein
MLISHKHKFVFIAVPKTASASVRQILEPYSDIISEGTTPPYDWHGMAFDLKKHFQEQSWNWNSYFKFAFVRNPWERLLSEFLYRKKRIKIFEGADDKPEYILKSEEIIKEVTNFSGFVCSNYINRKAPIVDPQSRFIFDESGDSLLDYVGRFENLQVGVDVVCDKIGIQPKSLELSNDTTHGRYEEHYNDKTRDIVKNIYAKDIEYFGYEFGR